LFKTSMRSLGELDEKTNHVKISKAWILNKIIAREKKLICLY
jgi:hypothetical protein